VEAGYFFGCGLEGQEGAIEFYTAVDDWLSGLEDQEVDELGASLGYGSERSLESCSAYVGRKTADLVADSDCVVEGLAS
jgi:hypothetical protein